MSGVSSLNSLISTAIRMQSVRRDHDMSQETKDALLRDLQKQNDGIVQVKEEQVEASDKGASVAAGGQSGGAVAAQPLGGKGSIVNKLA